MITNEKQYKITKGELARFKSAIDDFDPQPLLKQNIDPIIVEAQKRALISQYQTLQKQITEYEALRAGKVVLPEITDLSQLPELLIQARIANGLTQTTLAEKLGLKTQQIQRYESEKYSSAGLNRLVEIAEVLGVSISANLKSKLRFPEANLENELDQFPIEEMYKKGWFEGFQGNLLQLKNNAKELLESFFASAGINNYRMKLAFHKKNVRAGSKLNYQALLAWQARVLFRALSNPISSKYSHNKINQNWIKNLVQLSAFEDGPQRAKKYLNDAGLYLIIEPHLASTHLDGAAMKLHSGSPVIGMTLRHDRLDNFWFVLLHELGHILKHIDLDNSLEFFDNCDALDSSQMENEADVFSNESLISSSQWETCVARFTLSESAVKKQAEIWGISVAIIAGRIRKEQDNWTIFTNLIGQGAVRKQFPEVAFTV